VSIFQIGNFTQQKTRLATSSLTELNVSTLHPDLIKENIPQNKSFVKSVLALRNSNVDMTGIEPANPGLSGPGVYQHQAHDKSIAWNI